MPALSAGVILVRGVVAAREVLLAHPGGPFFARRDLGVWTFPKGLVEPGEAPEAAARRELLEETGLALPPDAPLRPLGEVRGSKGKRVLAWAVEADADPTALASNTFELEWPPRSGRRATFPELDRFAWLSLPEAHAKISPYLAPLLDRL